MQTKLWPEKFTPAAISPDELSEISRRDRSSVESHPIISEDKNVNDQCGSRLCRRLQMVSLRGPLK